MAGRAIYHYTSLSSLALILRHKTIRLNSLANVDDLLESMTKDFGWLGKYVFVSSWTHSVRENIALWNMYTPGMAGVRIGLSEDSVKFYTDAQGLLTNITSSAKGHYVIPSSTLIKDVEYVAEKQVPFKLLQVMKSKPPRLFHYYLPTLGTRKSDIWAFQEEARFVTFAVPKKSIKLIVNTLQQEVQLAILRKPKTALNYIDVKLDSGALDGIDLLLGPLCDQSHESIAKALVEKYIPNHKGSIMKSTLKVRRREQFSAI